MQTTEWLWASLTWGRLVLIALFTLPLLWLSILSLHRNRSDRRFPLLELLRIVVVALLVVTLLQPERVRLTPRTEAPLVAVLCDGSSSMTTEDLVMGTAPPRSRASWLNEQRTAEFWKPLEARYTVMVDDMAMPPPPITNGPPLDPGTDINQALMNTLNHYNGLRAILLLSDGDWNAGKHPLAAATKLAAREIPVFAVSVGSERYLPDLELTSVSAPAYGLMDEHISIPFTVQSRLPREVKTRVTLRHADGILASKDILIRPMGQTQDAVILVPKREGNQTFRMQLPLEPDEILKNNNEKVFTMALRREILNVLIIDSAPRWEFRFLHNSLWRDPGVKVKCLLLHPGMTPGDGRNYLAAFPAKREDLSRYDVVFLGDVGINDKELTPAHAEMLAALVKQQGSGLVFLPGILGHQKTLKDSVLEPLLPVEFNPSHPKGFGFRMPSRLSLTTQGRDHLLTMLASSPSANRDIWKRLPGFYWHASVTRAKVGSDVLAVHGTARNQHGRLPLLVTRPHGNGKVLFMGTDAAWRWRKGVEDTYHYRFWGQVVRWMAHQRHLAHSEGIRFFYTPESPARGETVYLHATVFDASGYPIKGGRVTATLTSNGGHRERLTLEPEPGGWGVFTGSFVPRYGGIHEAVVNCEEVNRHVRAQISVRSPIREVVGRPARRGVLNEIASITRGAGFSASELTKAISAIQLLPEPAPLEERFRLWCHPLWATLIVGLLAAYWTGRKLLGMI